MIINRVGTTRIVFIFKNVVVKVPNFCDGWLNFLTGLVANINENQTWKWNSGDYESGKSYLLCPVKWCSWGGWFLVMQRATPCEIGEKIDYIEWMKAGFGGDDKPDNYGWYNYRIVKIDYDYGLD